MLQLITLVPLLLSFYLSGTRSVRSAFLNVYLPVLLLCPDYFRFELPVIHRFSQAAAFGMVLFLRPRLKLSLMDFVIGIYVITTSASELMNSTFSDSLSLLIDSISNIVLPYMFGKYLIEQSGLRVAVARRFVVLVALVAIVSPIEFLTGKNYFYRFFYGFFEIWANWPAQYRWGFVRVAGPYGHAILCGCVFLCAILLQYWLFTCNGWSSRRIWNRWSTSQVAVVIALALCAGSFMSLSRGPWMGLGLGLVIASVGLSRNIVRDGILAAMLLASIAVPIYSHAAKYTSVDITKVTDEDQRNAVYRRQLLNVYDDFVQKGGLWGWGRAHRPVVHGMESVDNEYLLETLMFGTIGLIVFSTLGAASVLRILISAYSRNVETRTERMFRFTLVGIIGGILFSISTVFLGLQLIPILFIFIGWGEGVLVTTRARRREARPVYAFECVLQ
jgi:hypothetical protein